MDLSRDDLSLWSMDNDHESTEIWKSKLESTDNFKAYCNGSKIDKMTKQLEMNALALLTCNQV